MVVYKFRASFEDHSEVMRDIEVLSNQTFLDLHNCLLESVGYKSCNTAKFYLSDDYWNKGARISLEKDGKAVALMQNARMCDFINDPHQKIYFVLDKEDGWTFCIEMVKMTPGSGIDESYPRTVKTFGLAPEQYPNIKKLMAEAEEEAELIAFDVNEKKIDSDDAEQISTDDSFDFEKEGFEVNEPGEE